MKKIFCFVILSIILLFCSCQNREVRVVDDMILAIGTVTKESENQIKAARAAYDALDSKDKRDVENVSILIEAENSFAKLPIELTTENAMDYLNISITFSETKHGYLLSYPWSEAIATLEIYPVASGSFNNVSLKLNCLIGPQWKVSEGENMYSLFEEIEEETGGVYVMVFDVSLPSDGKYTETVNIEAQLDLYGLPKDKQFEKLSEIDTTWETSVYPKGTPVVTGYFIPN